MVVVWIMDWADLPFCALFALLWILIVTVFWIIRRKQVQAFTSGKNPQSDEEFLAGCGLPDNDGAKSVALGVRRVIATFGEIEPEYIHHNAVFASEINYLPFWDSLDGVELVMTLEDELGTAISDEEAESIRNPEFDKTGLAVRDFVSDVYRVVGARMATTCG